MTLYDTDSILQKGKVFPPEESKDRLTIYKQNAYLFDGDHTKVYVSLLRLFHSSTSETNKIILCLNWHRRLSCLWADLLVGKTPDVKVDEANDLAVKELRRDSQMWPEVYKALIDTSRFGTGLIKVYKDEDGLVHAQAVAPSKWFPIQDSNGQILEHLLAWTSESYDNHVLTTYLHCEIHRKGEVETRKYLFKEGKIISEAYDVEIDDTGIDDFLVVPLPNLLTTTNILGCDDYTSLDPIIKRLETRLTRLGRVLDIHAEPAFAVPEDAVSKDPTTGEMNYDSNLRIFPMAEGAQVPQYITWDAGLTASFQEIAFLMDQLYAISETCPQAFGQSVSGTAESGTSLRLRMMAPLKRVERLRINVEPALKKLMWLLAQLAGINLNIREISIGFNDGLPEDRYQDMQIESMAVLNKITSTKAAAKRIYRLTDDQADEDQAQMGEEAKVNGGGLF